MRRYGRTRLCALVCTTRQNAARRLGNGRKYASYYAHKHKIRKRDRSRLCIRLLYDTAASGDRREQRIPLLRDADHARYMRAIQKAQMNEIYEGEKRILMLNVENHKTKFSFPVHTINLTKPTIRPHKKINSFLKSVSIPCVTNGEGYQLNDGFVVIDIETTGLDKDADELIFVSAVKIANYKIIDTFEMFIKPSKPIPREIENFCGITNEMVSAAESAEMVVKKLIDFIRFDVIVTYDRGFIDDFLLPIFKKLGYEINTNPKLNLFYLVRKLYGNQLFSLSSRITSCASVIGVDITEIPSRFHEAEVLINILIRLRNEYEMRSIAELEKLY